MKINMRSGFNVTIVAIIFVFIVHLISAEEFYPWLHDLENAIKMTDYHPPLILTQTVDSNCITIWQEGDIQYQIFSEHDTFGSFLYRPCYISIHNVNGDVVVPKEEIQCWRGYPVNFYTFSNNTSLWLSPDSLLVIAFRMYCPYSDPVQYRMERVVFNKHGKMITGPDTCSVSISGPLYNTHLLLFNQKVYLINPSGWHIYTYLEVYPDFSEPIRPNKETVDAIYEVSHPFSSEGQSVFTSDGHLLFCCRIHWGKTPLEEQTNDWFLPHSIYYMIFDHNGSITKEPQLLDVWSSAFCKTPGIYIGGTYFTAQDTIDYQHITVGRHCMDLTVLPEDKIVLLVTSPDENGWLCTYQIEFSLEGEYIESHDIVESTPILLLQNAILPFIQRRWAVIWYDNSDKAQNVFMSYGFDHEGNFYANRSFIFERY